MMEAIIIGVSIYALYNALYALRDKMEKKYKNDK